MPHNVLSNRDRAKKEIEKSLTSQSLHIGVGRTDKEKDSIFSCRNKCYGRKDATRNDQERTLLLLLLRRFSRVRLFATKTGRHLMSFASPSTSTPWPHPVLNLLSALEGGWLRKTTLLGVLRLLDNWHPIGIERPWCWERLKAGGEGDDQGWDGWMALLTRWTWVWAGSRSWWWTGRPDALQSMGLRSQTWLSDWAELNWDWKKAKSEYLFTFAPSLQGDLGLALSLVMCYCF